MPPAVARKRAISRKRAIARKVCTGMNGLGYWGHVPPI